MRFGLAKKGGRVSGGWVGVNRVGGVGLATLSSGGWRGRREGWIEEGDLLDEKDGRGEGWGRVGAVLVGRCWSGGEGW